VPGKELDNGGGKMDLGKQGGRSKSGLQGKKTYALLNSTHRERKIVRSARLLKNEFLRRRPSPG